MKARHFLINQLIADCHINCVVVRSKGSELSLQKKISKVLSQIVNKSDDEFMEIESFFSPETDKRTVSIEIVNKKDRTKKQFLIFQVKEIGVIE